MVVMKRHKIYHVNHMINLLSRQAQELSKIPFIVSTLSRKWADVLISLFPIGCPLGRWSIRPKHNATNCSQFYAVKLHLFTPAISMGEQAAILGNIQWAASPEP
jgi:hypothetical protein